MTNEPEVGALRPVCIQDLVLVEDLDRFGADRLQALVVAAVTHSCRDGFFGAFTNFFNQMALLSVGEDGEAIENLVEFLQLLLLETQIDQQLLFGEIVDLSALDGSEQTLPALRCI